MSEGTFGFSRGDVLELTRLNRALTQLARPALKDAWQTPMTPSQLIDMGAFHWGCRSDAAEVAPRRQEVIERLWSRKRQILRQESALAWDPQPPVA